MLLEMKTTEPYSPSARANASAKPVSSAGRQHRKNHAPENLPAVRAEARGGFLKFRIEIFEHRLHGADDERQADERERDENAELRVGNLDAQRREPCANPAVRRIQRRQRDARDGGRQRERQIHQRVHNLFSEKIVAHQNPRDDESENRIDERGEKRRAETQTIRRERRRRKNRVRKLRPRQRRCVFQNTAASGISTMRPR